MYISKKRQSTFGIITQRKKILGAISLCGAMRLNAFISSLSLLEAFILEDAREEWDSITSTMLLKIMMRLPTHQQ
jgi:hypothetical protein